MLGVCTRLSDLYLVMIHLLGGAHKPEASASVGDSKFEEST
jgi:hypothetical protein